jgi:hypothetical protein
MGHFIVVAFPLFFSFAAVARGWVDREIFDWLGLQLLSQLGICIRYRTSDEVYNQD